MLPARLATLHEAVDRHSGERVRVRPQSGGGYVAGTDDPGRDPVEITAYVALIPASVRTSSSGANTGANVQARTSADTVKFKTSALAYDLVEGDLVDLLDRAGAPAFRVSRTAPFGVDRTIAFLTPAAP
jgi:hypothetical protein